MNSRSSHLCVRPRASLERHGFGRADKARWLLGFSPADEVANAAAQHRLKKF
jgi:hypothetical protein